MRIRAIRQHRSSVGFHLPGDEYEDTKANADYKIERGIAEAVEVKKAEPVENKKARQPKNKAE